MVLKFWKKKAEYGEVILKCPRCDRAMEKVTRQGVTIDVCNKCNGIWLDDKEIDKMVEKSLSLENKSSGKKQKR